MFRVTRYPMISKTESGQVSKEIPGSGSGSGTRWTLVIILIIWLYVVCDLLLKRHLQVPTFSEFVDYVVKETTGLESPKDWKVTNCSYKTRRCQRNKIRIRLLFQLPALVVENWYMVVKRGAEKLGFFSYSLSQSSAEAPAEPFSWVLILYNE